MEVHRKKSILSIVLVLAVLLSQISVFAFSDMNEERLSWAKTAVDEMSASGIIKGYEDGSFRPDNAVTKQETLVLISRILGFNEASSDKYVEIASEIYQGTLSSYSTPYKDEISYLLYKGVLNYDDLVVYAADSEAAQPLKRYEAAVLLTKIFETDLESVKKEEITIEFSDLSDIPVAAKPFVNYVCNKGLMNGMGDGLFLPNGKLTRAMIATLLYRVIPMIDYSYVEGSMLLFNEDDDTIRLGGDGEETVSYKIPSSAIIMVDGVAAKAADISAGSKVRLTLSGNKVVFVDSVSSAFENTITGIYNGYETYEDATSIIVKDAKTEESKKYVISSSITVIKNGKKSSITDLVKSDFVSVSIKAGKVIHIEAENKTTTVSGTIESIEFEPVFAIYINNKDVVLSYDCTDDVVVRRNSKLVELSDLAEGDKVNVTLTYGLISSITATSTVKNVLGVISEIVISNTPSITLSADGEKVSFSVSRSAVITSDIGKTIYDLRLGDTVDAKVEGSTITSLKVTAIAASDSTVSGTVEYINTSYGYIKLAESEALIFTKGAKVQDKSGHSLLIKNIKAGDTVTVFGTNTSAAIEASLIIVNK